MSSAHGCRWQPWLTIIFILLTPALQPYVRLLRIADFCNWKYVRNKKAMEHVKGLIVLFIKHLIIECLSKTVVYNSVHCWTQVIGGRAKWPLKVTSSTGNLSTADYLGEYRTAITCGAFPSTVTWQRPLSSFVVQFRSTGKESSSRHMSGWPRPLPT